MLDAYRSSGRRSRLLITAFVAGGWPGAVFLAGKELSTGREDSYLAVVALMVGMFGPRAFVFPYQDDSPRHLLWVTITMTAVSLLGSVFLPTLALQAGGRDATAVVTDVRWCQGDCPSLVRLAGLPERMDLGWSAHCSTERPDRDDRIAVRVDRFGIYPSWSLGGLLLAVFLTYAGYVCRLALSDEFMRRRRDAATADLLRRVAFGSLVSRAVRSQGTGVNESVRVRRVRWPRLRPSATADGDRWHVSRRTPGWWRRGLLFGSRWLSG